MAEGKTVTELQNLQNRFGDLTGVRFDATGDGMTLIEINNTAAQARIALQGAHLMTWTPHGQQPVIWLSSAATVKPGKSIRGGVPVCWPWFGPHATQAAFPGHGFARTVPWELIDVQAEPANTRLRFRLAENAIPKAQWPHATVAELLFEIGATLTCELITRNTGRDPIAIGDALHTYFAVSDVRKIKILGLDGLNYLDKVSAPAQKQQAGAVTIASEVDRVYLASTADCVIDDPEWQRRVRIAKRGSRTTVVWNPWIEKATKMGDLGPDGYLGMVCVESANAADDVVTVAPGNEHRLWVRYSVEA